MFGLTCSYGLFLVDPLMYCSFMLMKPFIRVSTFFMVCDLIVIMMVTLLWVWLLMVTSGFYMFVHDYEGLRGDEFCFRLLGMF